MASRFYDRGSYINILIEEWSILHGYIYGKRWKASNHKLELKIIVKNMDNQHNKYEK